MDALTTAFASLPPEYQWPTKFCAFTTIATWILSIITGNVSQIDRLWTFLPTIYAGYYALLPLWPHEPSFFLCLYTPKGVGWTVARDFSPRALLMLGLIVLWMFRLTYNTLRRGLFNPRDEDYRWAVLRSQLPPWLFQVVNFTFIAATQNVLLLMLGYPAKLASVSQPHGPLAASDYAFASLAVAVLLLEFISDNQQYSFHAYKHAYTAARNGNTTVVPYDAKKQWLGSRLSWTPTDAERGFLTRGLWAFARHPNFLCEQSFWWIINLMPLVGTSPPHLLTASELLSLLPTGSAITNNFPNSFVPFVEALWESHCHILPAACLSLLFISSTNYTESISMGKYPAYTAYRERVAMFGGPMTIFKGLWLKFNGRQAKVESLVWGAKDKIDKKE